MANMTGTVVCVQVEELAGFTQIEDTLGNREAFVLWLNPQVLTSFTRVLHSMWISLLREAHTNRSTVTILHPDDSGVVTSVVLGEAFLLE